MYWRILHKSFSRALKEKVLIILTVAFGASLASGMLNVALDVGDKMNQELKSFGSNIQVMPKMDTIPVEMEGTNLNLLGNQAFLQEEDLWKLKKIFWANNILGFTPYLETGGTVDASGVSFPVVGTWFKKERKLPDGNVFTTGISELKSWWKLDGAWPKESGNSPEAIVGKQLAKQLGLEAGDRLNLNIATSQGERPYQLQITGILDAGGPEDEMMFTSLASIQQLLGLQGLIQRAEVSALTVPDTELAKQVGTNPSGLREKDYEEWYCTAYTGAIAFQIEESMPDAHAKPILQIAESEGKILSKIQFMMVIISVAAVLSSALGISSLMNSKVQERRREIALIKALGGTDVSVSLLFLGEALISGLIGGIIGYGLGIILAQFVGQSVFETQLSIKWLGLPLILLLSMMVTAVGSYPAVRLIVKLEPIQALYGR